MPRGGMKDVLFGPFPQPNKERLNRLDHAIDLIEFVAQSVVTLSGQVRRLEWKMADWTSFDRNLTALVEGYRAATAKITVLEQQIENNAPSNVQDQIEQALREDDAVDQAKIDAADAAIVAGLERPSDDVGDDATPDVPTDPATTATDTGGATTAPVDDTPGDDGVPAGNP